MRAATEGEIVSFNWQRLENLQLEIFHKPMFGAQRAELIAELKREHYKLDPQGAIDADMRQAAAIIADLVAGIAGARTGSTRAPLASPGSLPRRGFNPPPGTRNIPPGIPESWRIRPTRGTGGAWYYDPANMGNAVRVMPGDPTSPYPNSQVPYVRWQRNGQPMDVNGNVLPTQMSPDAHIPLPDFLFNPGLYP